MDEIGVLPTGVEVVPTPTDSVPIPLKDAPVPMSAIALLSTPSPVAGAAQYAVYIHRDVERSGPAKQCPVTDSVPPKKRGFACSFPIYREHKMMIRCIGAGYFVYVNCSDNFRYTTEAIPRRQEAVPIIP
ncbi:hypothetical protein BGX34_001394 [Mortierella sp. NVP85]|nr:hypothetical protein BGX34_001394 [Mortierella sp. NVP85]